MEMNQNIPQISNSSQRTSTIIASEYDGLNLKEMREFVLTMIQRKDDLENKYKKLDENYKEELQKSKDLNDKLIQIEQETKIKTDNYENKIQNLESENKLLKDQLKKYVSAVQMIRSNTVCSTSDTSVSGNQIVSIIPAVNPNLQRDYSFEAEQYEKKLIQVAEMHGELMEFNSRLHKILNFKTLQIEKLKQELIELRGPLPNEMMLNETYDESFSMMSDIESLTNLNGPLINIWIPSAFLRTNKSDSHHVYQVSCFSLLLLLMLLIF
jgi:sorting nexin-29